MNVHSHYIHCCHTVPSPCPASHTATTTITITITITRLGIEEPTWFEAYGGEAQNEGSPFDAFFCMPGDADEALFEDNLDTVSLLLCSRRGLLSL